jgi:hypothetical protein
VRTEREGTLDVVACHGVHDTELDRFYGEHPEDRPVYDSQMVYAFNHLIWRKGVKPLLVFSGGLTKSERRCSESRSYIERAKKLGLRVPEQVALEEHALTSVENLILSLYVFHQNRGTYPESIEVISWEFKRRRFEKALDAINAWELLGHAWPALKFFPVGDLWGGAKKNALQAEYVDCEALEHGIDKYYQSPRTQQLIRGRDVFDSRQLAREAYAGYPLPF